MLIPRLEVVVSQNHVSARNVDTCQSASADGPFSCSHLLVDDVDILEHTIKRALSEFTGRFWTFPRIVVSTAGVPVHKIEQKVIRDALLNAGASKVIVDPSVELLDEQTTARSDYIDRWTRNR